MKPALLSIIIPTLNSERYLARCLDSILMQTFKDFEIIIIDGQSVDGTMNLVKKYTDGYSNIWFTHDNDNGIYDAINKGIKVAKGTWLYFLGSDDCLYTNNVLESVFSGAYSQYDIVYGNVHSETLGEEYDGRFDFEKLLTKNICHQAIFFKKEVFKKTGMFYTGYKAHADWEHNVKWMKDNSIHKLFVDKTIAFFGSGGLSSTYKDVLFDNFMIWQKAKYNKHRLKMADRLRIIKGTLRKARQTRDNKLFLHVIKDALYFIL